MKNALGILKITCAAIALALAALILSQTPAAAEKKFSPDAVVLYDQKFGSSMTSIGFRKEVRDFLSAFGFETMETGGLVEWMTGRIETGAKGTLAVINTDKMPAWIAGDKPGNNSLFRKYLEAGGNVLWYGDYPANEVSFQLEKNQQWGAEGSIGFTGVDATGDPEGRGKAEPTEKGMALGLRSRWESLRPVPADKVTETLAFAKPGFAAAWTKSFAPGSPGFIRIWDCRLDSLSAAQAADLFNITSKIVPGLAGRKAEAAIYFYRESDYYPLTRIEDGKLIREVRVAYFNESSPAGAKYELDIIVGGKIVETVPLDGSAAPYFIHSLRINVHAPDQSLKLMEKNGASRAEVVSATMYDPSFHAESRIAPDPAINPVDLGYVLVPGHIVLAAASQKLIADMKMIFPGSKGNHTVKAKIEVYSEKGELAAETGAFTLQDGKVADGRLDLPLGALAPGKYSLKLSITGKGMELYVVDKQLVIAAEKAAPGFGAYYADIAFPGSVGVFNYDKKTWTKISWARAWERGPDYDVVVPFANGNRFIFWRGSGYVPFWASAQNSGMTYEWLEAGQKRGVLFDAVEPLQDKECRYSRAYVISSGAARAVVGWRYALIGLGYDINSDEWADETYVFYPDGFGVRKAAGYLEPLSWHEGSEFIVLLPPGYNPFDVYPREIIRIMSPDGKQKESVVSPPGGSSWKTGGPAVFRVNYNTYDKNTPVLAVKKFEGFGSIYDGWKVDGRYISPNYWGVHFPVQRGYPTTRQEPPGWRERAGHASIATVTVEPFEKRTRHGKLESVVWGWFIGNTDKPDDFVLEAARSWLNPVMAEAVKGAEGGAYDVFQRGYVFKRQPSSGAIEIKFKGDRGEKIFNPVFIIDGFETDAVEVSIDRAAPKTWQASLERDYSGERLIVWIGEPVSAAADVRIAAKGK